MKRLLLQLGLLFVFLVSVSFAQDSTLAEIAKKEKERRAKLKASKTFTNKDVEEWKAKQKSSGALIEGESAAPTGEEQTAESTEAAKEQDVSSNEEHWRKKAQDANERLKKAQEKVDGVQSDINALNRAWYSGDMDDQRRQVEYERGKRLEEIETAKKELEQAKEAQEGLEDEARQAGAPPGWVRSEDEPENNSEEKPE